MAFSSSWRLLLSFLLPLTLPAVAAKVWSLLCSEEEEAAREKVLSARDVLCQETLILSAIESYREASLASLLVHLRVLQLGVGID